MDAARRIGLPVVHITLDGDIRIWELSEGAVDPVHDGHWKTLPPDDGGEPDFADLTAELAARLEPLLASPSAPKARECLCDFQAEPLRGGSFAIGYDAFRAIATWKSDRPVKFPCRLRYGLERERRCQWQGIARLADDIGGADFAETIRHRLKERWLRADNLALHYSHLYRTAYIANFVLAAMAVLMGSLIVFGKDAIGSHALLVFVELIFIGTILWITFHGRRKRWHNRWLDYRAQAEVLRAACLPILMGSSPSRPSLPAGTTPGQEWVVWYVRSALREIEAPRHVTIDPAALQDVLNVALTDEIAGQIAFHRSTEIRNAVIDRRLEVAAAALLTVTIASGAFFLAVYLGALLADWPAAVLPIRPWTAFLAGVLPVSGAALFGIRAMGDFRASSHQSGRMRRELKRLRLQFRTKRDAAVTSGPDDLLQPSRPMVRQMLAQLSRTMGDDLKVWGLIFSERELGTGIT